MYEADRSEYLADFLSIIIIIIVIIIIVVCVLESGTVSIFILRYCTNLTVEYCRIGYIVVVYMSAGNN